MLWKRLQHMKQKLGSSCSAASTPGVAPWSKGRDMPSRTRQELWHNDGQSGWANNGGKPWRMTGQQQQQQQQRQKRQPHGQQRVLQGQRYSHSSWWMVEDERQDLAHLSDAELVQRVKESDRAVWREFCDSTLGKRDPAVYPRRSLLAFVAGKGPPTGDDLVSCLDALSKQELILCCKAAVKQGAPPLEGRWRDPARYSEKELCDHLETHLGGVQERNYFKNMKQEDDVREERREEEAEKEDVEEEGEEEGQDEGQNEGKDEGEEEDEALMPAVGPTDDDDLETSTLGTQARTELVAAVKADNFQDWQDFCSLTLGMRDPAAYPSHYLEAFLLYKEPPPTGGPRGPLNEIPAEELVLICKAVVKEGCPPLEGDRGRDPARYTREELTEYLQSIQWAAEEAEAVLRAAQEEMEA